MSSSNYEGDDAIRDATDVVETYALSYKDNLIILRDTVVADVGLAPFSKVMDIGYFEQSFINLCQSACHGSKDAAFNFLWTTLPDCLLDISASGNWANVTLYIGANHKPIKGKADSTSRALVIAVLNALITIEDKASSSEIG